MQFADELQRSRVCSLLGFFVLQTHIFVFHSKNADFNLIFLMNVGHEIMNHEPFIKIAFNVQLEWNFMHCKTSKILSLEAITNGTTKLFYCFIKRCVARGN